MSMRREHLQLEASGRVANPTAESIDQLRDEEESLPDGGAPGGHGGGKSWSDDRVLLCNDGKIMSSLLGLSDSTCDVKDFLRRPSAEDLEKISALRGVAWCCCRRKWVASVLAV